MEKAQNYPINSESQGSYSWLISSLSWPLLMLTFAICFWVLGSKGQIPPAVPPYPIEMGLTLPIQSAKPGNCNSGL